MGIFRRRGKIASPRLELEEMRGEASKGVEWSGVEWSGESGPSGPCAGQSFEKLGNIFEKPSTQHSRRCARVAVLCQPAAAALHCQRSSKV